MTQPANSFYTDFGRFYAHPSSGVPSVLARQLLSDFELSQTRTAPNPSITNIIGMLDKAFLPPYYAKLVAEHAIANLDNLARTVAKFGPDVAIGTLKAIPSQPNPASAVGDEVHSAIEAHSKGLEIPELTTITATRMFAQYEHFLTKYPMRIVRSEFTVWSYEHGYAGTGDLMWETDDGLCIVDAKSGKEPHPEVAMQNSAIQRADVILDADGVEHPMPQAKKLYVLHVRPMSVKLHELDHLDEAYKAFLACKQLFDWKRFYYDSTILEPFKSERPKESKLCGLSRMLMVICGRKSGLVIFRSFSRRMMMFRLLMVSIRVSARSLFTVRPLSTFSPRSANGFLLHHDRPVLRLHCYFNRW